jgi:hypothetical protein
MEVDMVKSFALSETHKVFFLDRRISVHDLNQFVFDLCQFLEFLFCQFMERFNVTLG